MSSSTGKAIIKLPVKLIREMEKIRQNRAQNVEKFSKIYGVNRRESNLVISCRDPKLNHYYGQRYPDDGLLLATENWKKPKCDGDYFTIIKPRYEIFQDNDDQQIKNERRRKHPFDELSSKLSKSILEAVDEELNLKKMTLIQRKAIQPLLDGHNAFVAAQMGTGKTIAFLTPILERLIRWRNSDREPEAGCPRALILSPTRELNEQLLNVARKLTGRTSSIEVSMIRGGDDGIVYNIDLDKPGRDLLISTIGAALRYKNMGALKFDDLRHVVVDEADTLLSENVRDDLFPLLKEIEFNKSSSTCGKNAAQLIFVASTVPDDLQELVARLIGREAPFMHLTNDNLHRLPSYLRHRFLRLSRQFAPEALLTHVKRDAADKQRVAVFARDAATCEWLEHFLIESGVQVVALRGTMSGENRSNSYRRIVDGDFSVMVATDAAALGLDTQHLDHVINYQLPDTIGGYLRRAGRLGRLGGSFGRSGLVTTFVTEFWEVDYAEELERSVRLNESLSVNDIVRDRHKFEE